MVKNVKRYLKEQAKDDRNPPIRGEIYCVQQFQNLFLEHELKCVLSHRVVARCVSPSSDSSSTISTSAISKIFRAKVLNIAWRLQN